jgi:hypothetical protein
LFMVLWAVGWSGSAAAAVWAFVIGSYVLQTEIATAAVVVVLGASLVLRVARRARSGDGSIRLLRWSPAGVSGVSFLLFIWIAPVIELFRDRPNNLQLLWDFFTTGHTGPPPRQALAVAADALSALPFGNHDYVLALHRNAIQWVSFAALLIIGLVVAMALGHRRRQPMSVAMASSATVAATVGAASLIHADGPVYLYFALWLASVPLVVLLAVGVGLLGPSPTPTAANDPLYNRQTAYFVASGRPVVASRAVLPVGVAAVLIAAALSVSSDLRLGGVNTTTGSGPWPAGQAGPAQGKQRTVQDTLALTRAAESVLHPGDRWVGFRIGTDSLWPYVAGLVLALDERGVKSTVGPAQWALYFGRERPPGGQVNVAFALYPATDRSTPPGSIALAKVDGTILTYQRLNQ